MIVRREDFKDVEKLTNGSSKKIWFTCDSCGIGVLQAYKTYIKQKNGKYCRTCRNKHTANRPDVKRKQSLASKRMWKDKEYKAHMSKVLSKSCKKSWDKSNDTRRLSIYNRIPYDKLKSLLNKEGYDIVTKKNEYNTTVGNNILVICDNGHEYKTNIGRFNFGHRCKQCNMLKYDDIKKSFNDEGYELLTTDDEYESTVKTRLKYKCPVGHNHEITWSNWSLGHRCGKCSCVRSKSEQDLLEYISSIYDGDIVIHDRNIISPYELDIVLPDLNIAIEYCGLYWHSESKGKDKRYHLNKLEMCELKGYNLITIFEDEWNTKNDLVKNKISHILGINNSNPIYARKCFISTCDSKQAKMFCEKYHIQGYTPCSIKLAAYYDNKIVALMTFAKPSISKGGSRTQMDIWELSRFCTSGRVIGIAGKLLKHFQRNYSWKEIFSYADRRWSTGNMYDKIGFENKTITSPNYWYFYKKQSYNEYKRYHRFNFRKSVLNEKLNLFDPSRTEYENMLMNYWDRIWDCGNFKHSIKNPIQN